MDIKNAIGEIRDSRFDAILNCSDVKFRRHPLQIMMRTLENSELSQSQRINTYGYRILSSIIHVKNKHEDFFNSTWGRILKTSDDYNDAISICGEYRCLHILEDSRCSVEPISEKNGVSTPDFKVISYHGDVFNIEVFTPRMNSG